jgi:flagellar basal body rod protein FlgB
MVAESDGSHPEQLLISSGTNPARFPSSREFQNRVKLGQRILRSLQRTKTQANALDIVANNVANVSTAGYSRTGVSLENTASIRDPILQLRIQQETGTQGELSAFVNAMQPQNS